MVKELTIFNKGQEEPQAWCSWAPKTIEEKKALYNATASPEKALRECVNLTIAVKDVYVEMVDMKDEETGEITTGPRTVLIDTEGHSYGCVSSGVFNSIGRAMRIFGAPTWKDGINFTVKTIAKGKNNILTLEMV